MSARGLQGVGGRALRFCFSRTVQIPLQPLESTLNTMRSPRRRPLTGLLGRDSLGSGTQSPPVPSFTFSYCCVPAHPDPYQPPPQHASTQQRPRPFPLPFPSLPSPSAIPFLYASSPSSPIAPPTLTRRCLHVGFRAAAPPPAPPPPPPPAAAPARGAAAAAADAGLAAATGGVSARASPVVCAAAVMVDAPTTTTTTSTSNGNGNGKYNGNGNGGSASLAAAATAASAAAARATSRSSPSSGSISPGGPGQPPIKMVRLGPTVDVTATATTVTVTGSTAAAAPMLSTAGVIDDVEAEVKPPATPAVPAVEPGCLAGIWEKVRGFLLQYRIGFGVVSIF